MKKIVLSNEESAVKEPVRKNEPFLVGTNFKAINEDLSLVGELCEKLNAVGRLWIKTFDKRITLSEIRELADLRSPATFAKSKFIQENEKFRKLRELGIKEDKILSMLDFPLDFSDLKATVDDIVRIIGIIQAKSGLWAEDLIHFDSAFGYRTRDNALDLISPKYSYYAESREERIIFEKVNQLCDLVNFLNDHGADIYLSEIPFCDQALILVNTGVQNGSLKKSTNHTMNIVHWSPRFNMMKSPRVNIVLVNLEE